MITVKGVLGIKTTVEGGVRIRCGLTALPDHAAHEVELTGQEWQRVLDLVRQDAKLQRLLEEGREGAGQDVEGITWTP